MTKCDRTDKLGAREKRCTHKCLTGISRPIFKSLARGTFHGICRDRNRRAVLADRCRKTVADRKCSSLQRSMVHMLPDPRHKLVTLPNIGAALVATQKHGGKFDRACQGFIHSVALADVLGDFAKRAENFVRHLQAPSIRLGLVPDFLHTHRKRFGFAVVEADRPQVPRTRRDPASKYATLLTDGTMHYYNVYSYTIVWRFAQAVTFNFPGTSRVRLATVQILALQKATKDLRFPKAMGFDS